MGLMGFWEMRVNSDELRAEILEGLDAVYRKFNIKFNCKQYKAWERRESYLPKIKLRLIDVPKGIFPIIYKNLTRHEMAVAYEHQGVVYEAEIGNLDPDLNLQFPSKYNIYYLAVYSEGEYDIIKTKLFPKNRKHIYIPCGFLARCMPKVVFDVVWGTLKKFSVL